MGTIPRTFLLTTALLVAGLSAQQTTTHEPTTTTRVHSTPTPPTTEREHTTPTTASYYYTTTTEFVTTTTESSKKHSSNPNGQVAFIVGNVRTSDEVEIFSPDGKCQHSLATLPIAILPNPILFMFDEKIITCADTVYAYSEEDSNCWTYEAENDTWSRLETNKTWETFKRFGKPGILYDDVLFIVDDYRPEAFDPAMSAWSYWPKPINATSVGACMIKTNNSLILFGGLQSERTVQQYDVEAQSWKLLASPPMDIEYSGCTVLPNGKVLVLGSSSSIYRREAALYDVDKNSWTSLGGTTYDRFGTSLITLGDRVFAIGGGFDPDVEVEEYNYKDDTWIKIDIKPQLHRIKHTSMAVPASMFAHLPGGCTGI
jgi:hypothetical protein